MHRTMHSHRVGTLGVTGLVAGWLAASNPAAAAPLPADDPLAKIGHIVVVFEENRSFDNMFGLLPGPDGLSNVGETAHQIDAEGGVYETLPPVMNTAVRPVAPDPRFPSNLPNAPFAIDAYVPASEATGDLVHRFYQEQVQIDGGRMDKFAAVSDAGGLVMGYYNLSQSAHWRLAKEFALADRMFHSAFGGSMLNHTFLVCSCAFVWPNAPEEIVVKVDADGKMLKDGQVSPDGYVVNTGRSVFRPTPTRRGWCRRRRCRTSATGWTPRASAGRGTRAVTTMQSPAGPIRSFSSIISRWRISRTWHRECRHSGRISRP